MSVAAQRAITEMRKRVEAHVLRLPIGYFDSTKSGILISRIMTDAEGVRNLVGTGLVQLVGGVFTATLALGVLFWLNWQLTSITLVVISGWSRRIPPSGARSWSSRGECTGCSGTLPRASPA